MLGKKGSSVRSPRKTGFASFPFSIPASSAINVYINLPLSEISVIDDQHSVRSSVVVNIVVAPLFFLPGSLQECVPGWNFGLILTVSLSVLCHSRFFLILGIFWLIHGLFLPTLLRSIPPDSRFGYPKLYTVFDCCCPICTFSSHSFGVSSHSTCLSLSA